MNLEPVKVPFLRKDDGIYVFYSIPGTSKRRISKNPFCELVWFCQNCSYAENTRPELKPDPSEENSEEAGQKRSVEENNDPNSSAAL